MRFTPSKGEDGLKTPVKSGDDKPTSLLVAEAHELGQFLYEESASKVNKGVASGLESYIRGNGTYSAERAKFIGIDNGNKMLEIATNGWPEGSDKIMQLIPSLQTKVEALGSIEAVWKVDDYGERFSWEAALEGDWDIAYRRRKVTQGLLDNVVTLLVQVGGSCVLKPEQLYWSGAQGVLATQILEDAGYRVDLRSIAIGDHWHNGGSRNVSVIQVKSPEEPLRIDLVAANLAHPAHFRTVGFGMILVHDDEVDSGLGMCVNDGQGQIIDSLSEQGLLPKTHVFIGSAYNEESALQNVRAALEKSVEASRVSLDEVRYSG